MNEQKARHHRTLAIAVFTVLNVILLGGIERADAQWTTNVNNIYNTNSGSVGIGTSTPNKSSVSKAVTVNGSTDAIYELAIGDTRKGTMYHNGTNLSIFNNANGPLVFGTNNNERFRIDASGNVGIGTTTPGNTLELFGANPILKLNDGSNAYQLGFLATTISEAGHPVLYNTRSTNANSIFRVSGRGTGLSLGGGSFLGGQLHLYGTDMLADSTNFGSTLSLNTFTGAPYSGIPVGINFNSISGGTGVLGAFSFSMNSAVAMTIGTTGNVGIGTTGPGYKLDVQGGQVNASGGLCIAGDCKTAWSQVGGSGGAVSSVFGRTGAVVAAANDYTWAQINKSTSSLADLTTRSAGDLSSGTLPDARFPTALPAVSGTNLTALNASNLASGTVATSRLGSGTADSTKFLRGDNTWAVPSGGSQWTSSGASVYYDTGNVGIGTTQPGAKLEVSGNVNVTGTGNINAAGTITGGNIVAKYQDVAEWVESSQALAAGTVVVLDQTKSNQVIASLQAYDTRVAGVISLQPGIALGENGARKVLVATTGRVRIKVDASHGSIQVGDLLVTSDVPGVAMRSQPIDVGGVQIHRPGTLIGKALEPLAKGRGEILVLLSLQ